MTTSFSALDQSITTSLARSVEVVASAPSRSHAAMRTDEALEFVGQLTRQFRPAIAELAPRGSRRDEPLPSRRSSVVRGLHVLDRGVEVDGLAVPAGLLDFGLPFFHDAHAEIARGVRPHVYLPSLVSRAEARVWNDIFVAAQQELSIPRGTLRVTLRMQTLPPSFELDAIVYELREHLTPGSAARV